MSLLLEVASKPTLQPVTNIALKFSWRIIHRAIVSPPVAVDRSKPHVLPRIKRQPNPQVRRPFSWLNRSRLEYPAEFVAIRHGSQVSNHDLRIRNLLEIFRLDGRSRLNVSWHLEDFDSSNPSLVDSSSNRREGRSSTVRFILLRRKGQLKNENSHPPKNPDFSLAGPSSLHPRAHVQLLSARHSRQGHTSRKKAHE
jgi:hypothetical protein